MELLIISLLLIPFIMGCLAGVYGLLQHAAQAAHNRRMERLRTEGEVYTLRPDPNGNMPAIYVPGIERVLHPQSGNVGPAYPQLTHFTYSPNNSSSMTGKPLQIGGDQRNQSALVINRWRGKPEDVAADDQEQPQEDVESPELPAPADDNLPPEQAALGLLSEGLSIRQVMTATGLTNHAVRNLRERLNLNNPE